MNNKELDETLDALAQARETIGELIVNSNNPEAWPTFTGTPSSTIPKLLEWAVVKDVEPTDLLLVIAAIAYAHGKKVSAAEATNAKVAASE